MGSGRSLILGLVALSACVGALLAWPLAVGAAPAFTVGSTLDEPDASLGDGNCVSAPSGKCTLRAAVQEVEYAGGGTVTVSAGVYVLTISPGGETCSTTDVPCGATGDLDISSPGVTTILGAGADRTIIDGNGTHRVFDIHPGGDAYISGVTIRHGYGDVDPVTTHHHGGGIHNHGHLTLVDSTVSNSASNDPAWGGGGITNAGTMLLQNVTISRDSTSSQGGGLENRPGSSVGLYNVTIAENSAPAASGGGVYNAGTTAMANTIVAKDTSGGDCSGTITSLGHNLAGDASCALAQPGDLNSTNALLDPVSNNAGSIFLYALLPGSPAIDAGSNTYCTSTDERGVSRPQDGNADGTPVCDIGAYEAQPGQITVTKKLVPAYDPGRFNLQIDGTTYASNVGDNGTTGPVTLLPGSHTVSETAGTNAVLSRYVTTITCSDGSFGVGTSLSGVQAGPGGSVSCTIKNTRRLYKA